MQDRLTPAWRYISGAAPQPAIRSMIEGEFRIDRVETGYMPARSR